MPLSLYCGNFFPWLEEEVVRGLRDDLAGRKHPLQEQVLVVVPTRALRVQLLHALNRDATSNLYGVNILSLNQLCIEIILDTLDSPCRILSDNIFFPFVVYRIACATNNTKFSSFRMCAGLYQTLKDLIDANIPSTLLNDVLQDPGDEPEMFSGVSLRDLESLIDIYEKFECFLERNGIINVETSAFTAAGNASRWIQNKNLSSIYMYGFYDSTKTQLDVLETLIRGVNERTGNARIFFPFPVTSSNIVEHPARFSQQFYDRISSLSEQLGGIIIREDNCRFGATAGIEQLLFVADPEPEQLARTQASHKIEFISTAGPYDEAWVVAKRILNLVRNEGVRFDQILVIGRSNSTDLLPLAHVFGENHIPFKLHHLHKISFLPFARFTLLALQAREACMNNPSLFQFLSSPFLDIGHRDIHNIGRLMEELLIKNWNDWERLKYLGEDVGTSLPATERDSKETIEAMRGTVNILFSLKDQLSQIPESASLPEFGRVLLRILQNLCESVHSSFSSPILLLLQKIADYSALEDFTIQLSEFSDVLKQYFRAAEYEPDEQEAPSGVIVGDVMQLRGCSADFVFAIGLNKDVFPRRQQEDPFLPDSARKMLRSFTGTEISIHRGERERTPLLFPLKGETDEELLLFYLVLRSARMKLSLCYQRANEQGQKVSCSTYLDEALRLATGKTSQSNNAIIVVPKHHTSKFTPDILPTRVECSTLANIFGGKEIISILHKIPDVYIDYVNDFGTLLHSTELAESSNVDGCITNIGELWSSVSNTLTGEHEKQLRLSYSRFKSYLQCPFQFYANEILRIRASPKDVKETKHDISPLLKGWMAEDVIKNAIRIFRGVNIALESGVSKASDATRTRYTAFLPPLLLDLYINQFHQAALIFFEHVQREGFDLASCEIPNSDEVIEAILVPGIKEEDIPGISIRGIPDLMLSKQKRPPSLIGELKWGSRPVGSSPGKIFSTAEAQFCIYPFLVEKKIGKRLPFQYFRLDAFTLYGLPQRILSLLIKLGPSSTLNVEKVTRLFGEKIFNAAACTTESESQEHYLKLCQRHGRAIQCGQFRIIEDPSLSWAACRSCAFTQVCRKTHTPTLLRSRKAER